MTTSDRNDDGLARSIAIDPNRSVIVQAPAGSGKTTLLVNRYLKLLALAEEPEHVLAITFTRKAAAEMRQRVIDQLRTKTEVAVPAHDRASDRNWHLLENPQRLRIQTIDSFALGIIQQQPFATRFGLEYRFAEDARWLYQEAADRLLEKTEDKDPLSSDISRFVSMIGNDFELARNLVADMLSRREQWLDPVSNAARDSMGNDPGRFIQLIESAIESILDRTIATLRAAIPQNTLGEIKELCTISASNLEQPFSNLSNPRDWCFFSRIATTKNRSFRARITVLEGFPSEAGHEKKRLAVVMQSLADLGLTKTVANLQHIPDKKIPVDECEKLSTFSIVLTVAAAELIEVFRLHQRIDFSEITISARNALSRNEMPTDLALMLDYRTFHILVDEFQDTSLEQYKLLTSLVQSWQPGDSNTFFAVGDPMQSIYRFRDADINLYQSTFKEGLPTIPLDSVRLKTNFRSSAALVDWTNDVFSRIFPSSEDTLTGSVPFNVARAVRKEPGSVHAFVANDRASEANGVADRIVSLRSKHPGDSIAILVRSRNVLPLIIDALQETKLTWRGVDLEPLVNVPVVRDLYAITLALMNRHNRLAWLSIFRSPLVGITLCDLEGIARHLSVEDMLADTTLSPDARERLNRVVDARKVATAGRSIRSRVERFWLAMGGADAYNDRTTASLDCADCYLEALENQPSNRIFADQLLEQTQRLFSSASTDSVDVEIMTIHRAKGLEFDHVIIPGLDRGTQSNIRPLFLWRSEADALLAATRNDSKTNSLYSWLRFEEAEKDSQELNRLLYVAATRAKDSLSLFGCQTPDSNPTRGSFMALLQPLISFQPIEIAVVKPATATSSSRTPLKRLKSSYTWREPFSPPLTPSSLRALPSIDANQPIADRKEVALGNLVHEELQSLAGTNTPMPTRVNLDPWHERLIYLGLNEDETVWVLKHANKQLNSVLEDDAGSWILDSNHLDSHTEWRLTTYHDSQFTNVVIDRSFVDASGDRWLIDYKTAVPNAPLDIFIEDQTTRYTSQLCRYADLVKSLDHRTIRKALFLTAIPQLIEISDIGD